MSQRNPPKTVVFVTCHYWDSKRRAGFHWLADAFWRAGWQVLFLTTSLSWLSIPRRDHRLRYGLGHVNRLVLGKERFWSYVLFTPWHPVSVRSPLLDRWLTPLFRQYGTLDLSPCEALLTAANLFVFESAAGLMLFDQLKQRNPTARYLYRVSDDLRHLRSHPIVLEQERRILDQFDWVSVPSQYIFEHLRQFTDRISLDYHAIAKALFDQPLPNPYDGGPNLIFVGVAYADLTFIDIASYHRPDLTFHIIGPIRNLPRRPNVKAYGELPFREALPYLKHADAGLQCLEYRNGAESFSDSLKVIQYTYCRLPFIAPDFLRTRHPHACYYSPGDKESIVNALTKALEYDRSKIDHSMVYSWDELMNLWMANPCLC